MNYDPTKIEHLCAQTTRKMGFFNKADVLILIDDRVEWVSVKKFVISFNQMDKRRIGDYAKAWNMPEEVTEIFKRYCGEHRYRPQDLLDEKRLRGISDERRFKMNELSQVQREQVLDFLNENKRKIVRDVVHGSGKASAKWMLIVQEENGNPIRSAIVPMSLIIEYCSGGASITDRGNIRLGELTIQRKGGDAGRATARMLQFKFSPKKVFDLQGVHIIEKPTSSTNIDTS